MFLHGYSWGEQPSNLMVTIEQPSTLMVFSEQPLNLMVNNDDGKTVKLC